MVKEPIEPDTTMKTRINPWKLPAICLLLAGYSANAAQGHVAVAQNLTNFTYTISNEEPPGSQLFLSNFHLESNAPFQVISSPAGWSFITDNFSYIDWFCTNTVSPFPNDVAPGALLGGFVIQSALTNSESLGFALVSWQHGTTNSGPSIQGFVAAPSIPTLDATLTQPSHAGSNAFEFTVLGIPSFDYAVQSSADFVNWTPFATNSAPFRVLETNTLWPLRFYRAVSTFDVLAVSQD